MCSNKDFMEPLRGHGDENRWDGMKNSISMLLCSLHSLAKHLLLLTYTVVCLPLHIIVITNVLQANVKALE